MSGGLLCRDRTQLGHETGRQLLINLNSGRSNRKDKLAKNPNLKLDGVAECRGLLLPVPPWIKRAGVSAWLVAESCPLRSLADFIQQQNGTATFQRRRH
jgi:hypothetical protein